MKTPPAKFVARLSNGVESWNVFNTGGRYRFEPVNGGQNFTVLPSELDDDTRRALGETVIRVTDRRTTRVGQPPTPEKDISEN